jgi:polyhydroxybutyrate depolymerase
MAGRVACNLSDIVAAIAPISANHFYNDGCTPLRPVPVLAVHGRADEIAPYEGKSTLLANIPFYMEQWVARNSCNEDAEVSEWEPGGNSVIEQVTIEHWSGCADDADVYLYTYEEMGHAYPATTAPDLIWDFFLEHPLPEEYLDNPPTEPIVIELDESQEASGIQVAPGSYVADVIVLGQRREYFLHVPEAYDPATSIPLVISFHDFASDPPSNARRTGLLAKAEEEGFVVVFPGGSGDPLGWYTLSDPPPALPDDVEYTRRLLDQLQAQMNIDTARIFVTGYSNGGGMAHRVACELPDRITAIGVVAAGHFNDDPCGPDQPVPVYAIHGRIDGIIPYAGNETTMPIPDWALQWTQRNQCDEVPVEEPSNDSETTIITWDDCANNATVTLMTIDDLGHDYPDGATDRLWDFFASFPRTDEDENEETDEPIAYEPGDYSGSVFSWGTLRHYNFHLPPQYDGETELPLLISIHGFTGTPASNARSTQFAQKADEEGFIVVFPEGRDAGNGQLGWYSRDIAPPNFPDDNRFLQAMVEQLEREIVFDSNRIYATGMSNGGGMAHRLGCDMSDIIAAVAPVAGAHSIEDTCEPGRPVPVIALHGREDAIVGYDGIEDIAAPIPDWALDWAERNGCDLEPTVTTPEEGITVETWANCEAGVEVVLVSYDDAGHRWMPDATDRVWDFLSQYTLDAGSAPVSP